jgi:hypothetical protein
MIQPVARASGETSALGDHQRLIADTNLQPGDGGPLHYCCS